MKLPFTLSAAHRFLVRASVLFVLLLLIAVCAGRIAGRTGGFVLDLGGRHIATLSPETAAFLARLDGDLAMTYFVSGRGRMPSHYRDVETSVRALLNAMRGASPRRISYRVIDPDLGGPEGAAYAARKGASPVSVRSVRRDERSEQKVWSSLVLAHARHPEILIQGIAPDDLPHLEDLILGRLKALENPVRPVIALSAPPPFRLLAEQLGAHGRLLEIDLDRLPRIPPEADLLFWIQPGRVTPEHRREFARFVKRGRTAVLAGSPYLVDYERTEAGDVRYRAHPLAPAWEELLAPLGISPQPDLLMDESAGPVYWGAPDGSAHEVHAPFHLRCMPGFYDLKGFAAPARGALSFIAAGALQVDPRRAGEAGFSAEVLGTTTEKARVQALPQAPFTNADLQDGLDVGKQNLMLHLESLDPWAGQILVLASSSPFRDGILNQPGYAHRVFLNTLLRTFTLPERLIRGRVQRPGPAPLPPLGAGERLFWRILAVFLAPALLLALAARSYGAASGAWTAVKTGAGLPARAAAGLAALLLGAWAWAGATGPALDLSRDDAGSLLPETRAFFADRARSLNARLVITPRADLPAPLKGVRRTVERHLRGLGIPFRTLHPEHAGPQAQGLLPFTVETVRQDATVTHRVWSGLRLFRNGRATTIPRLDGRTLGHLEFLLVAAALRLETGRTPHVAVLAEPPRLSPAEAYADYYQKGLIPPQGVDIYSEAKRLLRDYGYGVSFVDPRDPHLPGDADILLWFQPRRDATQPIRLLGRHLSQGRRAIVALQHFNIQQRQYRGEGFKTVYWPQPQFQDLDRYLRLLGVEQVREVLMDRTRSRLALETQINRRAVREYEAQEVALPFLIRAVPPSFAPGDPVTRNLGDLLFIWGNRFSLDETRLAELGIAHQTLISTSDRAWAYPWKGGWLPEEVLAPQPPLPGPAPLALRLRGPFPPVRTGENGDLQLASAAPEQAGELILIGCSEMFGNERLYQPGFQHHQFLLNAVASQAYPPETAGLQARRRPPQGFPFQPPAEKAFWRAAVVGAGPLLILLYGLSRRLRRKEPKV